MGRHKRYDGPTEFIGGRIRQDYLSDLLESLGRQPMQQFLEDVVEARVEEFRRRKELKSIINGSTNKDIYNSPLGTALSINIRQLSNSRDINRSAKDRPTIEMIEQMYLTPFDEIVKNNLDDIEYLQKIRYLLKKRYEFVDTIVRQNHSKKGKRLYELEEAMRRDRERRHMVNQELE